MGVFSGGGPSSLPPSGAASGDLSGTYPGPTVAKVNAVAVTGTPQVGYVPTATSASAATWQAGGAAPTARQALGSPSTVTIANGGNARLRWNGTSFGPNVLLDRTNDDLPSVLTSGIYGVCVTVGTGALTAGGSYEVTLELDRDDIDAVMAQESTTATAAVATPRVSLAFAWYIPASGTIAVTVRNHDGVAAVAFGLEVAQIQKIT